MGMELDDWDRSFLARAHTVDEYRAAIKSALERCAWYSDSIYRLAETLRATVDLLRRLDPIHCASNDLPSVTDEEIDALLKTLEDQKELGL